MLWPARIASVCFIIVNLIARPLTDLPGVPWWRGLPAISILGAWIVLSYTEPGRRHVRSAALVVALYGPVGIALVSRLSPVEWLDHAGATWIAFTVGACVLLQLGFLRTLLVVAAFSGGFHYVMHLAGIDGRALLAEIAAFH